MSACRWHARSSKCMAAGSGPKSAPERCGASACPSARPLRCRRQGQPDRGVPESRSAPSDPHLYLVARAVHLHVSSTQPQPCALFGGYDRAFEHQLRESVALGAGHADDDSAWAGRVGIAATGAAGAAVMDAKFGFAEWAGTLDDESDR